MRHRGIATKFKDYQACEKCQAEIPLGGGTCPNCGNTIPYERVYAFAPWWERMISTYLDFIMVAMVVGIPLFAALDVAGIDMNAPDAPGWPVAVIFGAVFVYWVVLEWRMGTTVGKLIFRNRVLRYSERPVKLWQSLIRNIFKMIGLGGSLITLLCIALSRRSQRIGDMLARTIVVKDVTERMQRDFWQSPVGQQHFQAAYQAWEQTQPTVAAQPQPAPSEPPTAHG